MTENKSYPIPKTYDPKTIDPKWRKFWKEKDLFRADPHSSKPPYCIVIPPPNVTGALHMGHALVNTLQDLLIRWKRMSGYETLWVPGTDHAGIATQTVVERHLMKIEGKKRSDYDREEFLEHIWDWKKKSEQRILEQLKQLGSSCDWSRLRFTMDEQNNRAVRVTFKKLFDEGLIYRGDYLVNWDPVTQTALADDEVEYEDRQSHLWYFKYPLKGEKDHVTVATTRPETMLGDTAVAVSPRDQRYQHLVGKTILLPLVNREIPIIVNHRVDPDFGTGIVKITPAHDPNDYEMGLEYHLPLVNIMTPDGRINENGGRFSGLTMREARIAVVKAMKELELVDKIEPHTHRVGVSYRSKATIEPYLSKQWYVRMKPFVDILRKVIHEKEVHLKPKGWEKTYFHWIDHLRDWCISRQLWWGHRIPIWYKKGDPDTLLCYSEEGLPPEVEADPDGWEQDSDVLDTWFSSALWPFASLGWPEKTAEFKRFYPTATLITGHDILFFWVARMIAMGTYLTDTPPFPEVFLHGLIYGRSYWRQNPEGGITYVSAEERKSYDMGNPLPKDVQAKWEKMSKSKGNIIDPLEVIDEYGTDAIRLALCASATQNPQIDLDRRRFEEFKNFVNKVWNGARFVIMNLAEEPYPLTAEQFTEGLNLSLLALEDRWILSILTKRIQSVIHHMGHYQMDQAALEAYDFFWKEFCAYYVEICKPVLFAKTGTPEQRTNKQKVLLIVLTASVRLLHPMAPFITEELYSRIRQQIGEVPKKADVDPWTAETLLALQAQACCVAPYPKPLTEISDSLEHFSLLQELVYTIRNIRGEMKLHPSTSTDVHVVGSTDDPARNLVQEHKTIILSLVRVNTIHFHTQEPALGFQSTASCKNLKIIIPMPPALLDTERKRLAKEEEKVLKSLDQLRRQLDNQAFIERAPKALVDKQKTQLTEKELQLTTIQNRRKELESVPG